MRKGILPGCAGKYSLATGQAAAHRLQILHNVYGPGTRDLLIRAGIKPGMACVDLGCGVGMVTRMLAELVGRGGSVIGVDASEAQVAEAKRSGGKFPNARFVQATACDTTLDAGTFDLVYCRFLLIHLTDPDGCLCEMQKLLKPGGIFVCEDGDLTSGGSEPPSALDAFGTLFGGLGPTRGVDYTLGRRLYNLVQTRGFVRPEISCYQPAVPRGRNKCLLEESVMEAGAAFIEAGLITAEQLGVTLTAMHQCADDETIVALMPRMTQVWARKMKSRVGRHRTNGRN